MARIYAKDDGTLARVDAAEQAAPEGDTLEFDPSTNPELARLLGANLAGWRLAEGTLARDGVAVVVNPAGPEYTARQAAVAARAHDLASARDALAVLEGDKYPDDAALRAALRVLLRQALPAETN